MIIKAYNWLRDDIKKTGMFIMVTETLSFLAFLVHLSFIYMTQSFKDVYLSYFAITPYVTMIVGVSILIMLAYCCVVSIVRIGELINRIKVRNFYE